MLRATSCGLQVTRSSLRDDYSKILVAFFLLCFIIDPLFSQELFTDLEDSTFSKQWININIIDSNQAHSGMHYSIADPDFPFGLGFEGRFPEIVRGRNVRMYCEAWVKSNVQYDQALFVISIQSEIGNIFWKSVPLSKSLTQENKWVNFSTTINIPGSITKNDILKAYLWNNDKKDTIAIDDLQFSFEMLPIHSFLPEISSFQLNNASQSDRLLMSNSFFTIYYNEGNHSIRINSSLEERLIENIWYYVENDSGDIFSENRRFSFISENSSRKGKRLIFETGSEQMVLNCSFNSPEIEVVIQKEFGKDEIVKRSSVVIQSGQETHKVYRANRKTDTSDFQAEYWLAKQGVQFGSKVNSWFIYHQNDISSLQLNTNNDQLWINLDYEKDHPFLHFPIIEDEIDVKIDQSTGYYKTGAKVSSSFVIHAGLALDKIPRLMKNPSGYLSAYIWTEHADFTDIRTNRATYFGSEQIENANDAIGGFVKYNIPVTKSVFYINPDSITNDEVSQGRFSSLESTIQGDSEFKDFLYQLKDLNYEICLHSPEQFTSSKKVMKKALKFTSRKFSSPTWIDHGYNNGLRNNREDLVCDGVMEGSENYSLKYWSKSDVEYFWNPYYEDYYSFDSLQFGELLSKPYHGFGDHIPDPDYWQHPTRTGELYHWPTKSVTYVERDELWEFLYGDIILKDFVNGWCIQFNHSYPAWVDPEKGFWYYDENGVIKAREGFNRTLERMAKLRDDGLLNLTTVKDFMDYELSLEQIDYQFLSDGSIVVTNNGKQSIKGLSFAVLAKEILVNGLEPQHKLIDQDIIFWFDIKAGESKIIQVTD